MHSASIVYAVHDPRSRQQLLITIISYKPQSGLSLLGLLGMRLPFSNHFMINFYVKWRQMYT